jgi:hypothetical protein
MSDIQVRLNLPTYLQTCIVYIERKVTIANLEWRSLIIDERSSNDVEL